MGTDIAKSDLLRELGYGGDLALVDTWLQEAGLSNPSKLRISADKREAVAALLAAKALLVCSRGDCQAAAQARRGERITVPAVAPSHCGICGGSISKRMVDEMLDHCANRKWTRLCIVGGSPAARQEFERLVAGRVGLRLIEGDKARKKAEAQNDMSWADCVVIWGSTQLDHRVSALYDQAHVIQINRRSVQDLAEAVIKSAQRPPRSNR